MIDIPTKVDGTSVLPAEEFNSLVNGIETAITTSGQTLSGASTNQVARAIANYVAQSDFYTDSGSANSYVLTIVNNYRRASDYGNGMRVRFRAANANTGASTVNVGGLGDKDIKKGTDTFSALESGDIQNGQYIQLVYNSSADAFILETFILQDFLQTSETNTLEVGFTTTVHDLGNSGTATVTPSIANSSMQTITINGSFTLATPSDSDSGYLEIEATNDGVGAYTVTFSGYDTISGTYNSTANAVNLFRITKIGTTSYLEIVQP